MLALSEMCGDQARWLTQHRSHELDALVLLKARSNRSYHTPLPLRKFLGRSGVQRSLYQLAAAQIRCCAIVDMDGGQDIGDLLTSQVDELELGNIAVCHLKGLSLTGPDLTWSSQVVVVDARLVFDSRLMKKMLSYGAPVRMTSSSGQVLGLARLKKEDVKLLDFNQDLSEQIAALATLPESSIESIVRYVPNLRRNIPPYWQILNQESDLDEAEWKVMDSAQKGVLDFPARYLHPIAENFLAKFAASTRVTPNQITVFSAVLAFIGTYWFATQSYLPALLIAMAAGILDGVDGKLARVKLLSSPFGHRLDHILDVSFEFSWYVAIGWGLYQATGDGFVFAYGFVLIGLMLIARALSGIYLLQTGHQIHDHTAFDRAVRLFAGRRNIYILVLLAGYLSDNFLASFYLVVLWAALTVVIYTVRNIFVFAKKLLPV